jgi:hypothetical protein
MFSEQPIETRMVIYGIMIAAYLLLVYLAFDAGMNYQKEHGAPGRECKTGTYREPGEPGGSAVCENGHWFWVAPEAVPVDNLKKQK